MNLHIRTMTGILLTCSLALFAAESGAPPVKVTGVDHYSEAGATHLVVKAEEPFFYTLYRPTPDSLVVEIPGMDVSVHAAAVQAMRSPEVLGADAAVQKPGTPDAKTVLSLQMAPGATHAHWMQGTTFYLDVFAPTPGVGAAPSGTAPAGPEAAPSPAGAVAVMDEEDVDEPEAPAAKPAEVVAAAEVMAAPPAENIPPARTLRDVKVSASGVTLVGDGAFRWETFELSNPHRIVVDVKGVVNAMGGRAIPGGGADKVERVRVSQFRTEPEKITRVVLDMKVPAAYAVEGRGKQLEIVVGAKPKAASSAEAPQAASAAPGETSPKASSEPKQAEAAAVPAAYEPILKPVALVKDDTAPADIAAPAFRVEREAAPSQAEWAGAPVTRFESSGTTMTLGEGSAANRGGDFAAATIAGEKQYGGEPITLDLKDADIKDIFRLFSDMSGLNFVLDKAVSGRITIMLKDVPWDQALDVILKNEGWGQVAQNNVVFIAPLARLAKEESERKKLRDAQEVAEDPITRMFPLSYTKSSEMSALIKAGKILTKQGETFEDKRGNILFVRDVAKRVELVEQLINVVDKSMPQVEIEARIVETTKDYAKGMGIAWGASARADQSHGTTTNLQFPHRVQADYAVLLPAGGAFSFLDLSMGNVLDSFTLDVQLSMMERHGKGKVLSSPRVVTLNNQKASIESGVQIPYIVTTDLQISVSFQSATIKLDVTPQITHDNTVIMDIDVNKREPGATVTGAGISVPSIITRKAKTQLLVKDGGTAVIGGVFQVGENMSQQQVPGLHRIPGLGWLFRSKDRNTRNDELLIFITPRIQRLQV